MNGGSIAEMEQFLFRLDGFFMETVQYFLQGDMGHLFFGALLHLVVTVAQCQLNVYADTAGRVGVRVLVQERLVAFDGTVAVEQGDGIGRA